jgi:hypothetical protein
MTSTWRKVSVSSRVESPAKSSKPIAGFAQDGPFSLFGERSLAVLKDILLGSISVKAPNSPRKGP